MGKKQKQKVSGKMRRNRMILIGAAAAIAAIVGVFGYYSSIPANGTSPVFGLASNYFIKASYDARGGYIYVSQPTGGVKGLRTTSGSVVNPTYTFAKGDLQSIHVINEDYDTHSKHNFNVDAFNVHTKDLGYFESQTVTFLSDKPGTYQYYCTIHPEMKGNIEIQ